LILKITNKRGAGGSPSASPEKKQKMHGISAYFRERANRIGGTKRQ